MYSSRFRPKLFITCIIIFLAPLSAIANLPTPQQQLKDIYVIDDNEESLGALPLLEESEYTDYVEQTYPIDEHYGESQKS